MLSKFISGEVGMADNVISSNRLRSILPGNAISITSSNLRKRASSSDTFKLVVAITRPGASYSSSKVSNIFTILGTSPTSCVVVLDFAIKSHSSSNKTTGSFLQ